MKMIMFWLVMVFVSVLAIIFYKQTSILETVWDPKNSSPWFDFVIMILCGWTAIIRGILAFQKWF